MAASRQCDQSLLPLPICAACVTRVVLRRRRVGEIATRGQRSHVRDIDLA